MSLLWQKFKHVLGYEEKGKKQHKLPPKVIKRIKHLMNVKLTETQKKQVTEEINKKVFMQEHKDEEGHELCQVLTKDGNLCRNHAYINFSLYGCCKLCRTHALMYGVYVALIIAKKIGTMHVDEDTYCSYYPDECYTKEGTAQTS
jgi:hypothetical protein